MKKLLLLAVALVALILLPIPLLPPESMVEFAQSRLGCGAAAAYLLCAITVQVMIYCALGLSAAFAVNRAQTARGRLLQGMVLPLVVAGLGLTIRSLRAGHLPVLTNAVVPLAACMGGVILGLSLLYRRWKPAVCIVTLAAGAALWVIFAGGLQLRAATEEHLGRIVAAGPGLPSGDARFGALLQAAFATSETERTALSIMEQNHAAILAFGIAVGQSNIARLIGLKTDSVLVQNAVALSQGTTLNGRADWPRHFAVSAALEVLGDPIVSDAGGLMKEQLDTLTRGGSGFSFGDLAADRAGVLFALSATRSDAAARAMQTRLHSGFCQKDYFPLDARFPENLSIEEFRQKFGSVGSERYRSTVSDIDAALERCSALSSH